MPSRRLSVVELQNAAKPLAHDDAPSGSRCASRERNEVVEALVIALGVVVLDELLHDAPQVTLAERNNMSQALLPDRANEPLGIRVQIRAPRRQAQQVDVHVGEQPLELARVEGIPVDDEVNEAPERPVVSQNSTHAFTRPFSHRT